MDGTSATAAGRLRSKAGAIAFYAVVAAFMIWWLAGVRASNAASDVRDAAARAVQATIDHRNRTGEWPTAAQVRDATPQPAGRQLTLTTSASAATVRVRGGGHVFSARLARGRAELRCDAPRQSCRGGRWTAKLTPVR
jgi:hypothetical protein